MRTLYIDSDFKLYTTNEDGRTAIETDAFDGMPNQVVECYRFIPIGKSYTKTDGRTVHGEFIQPFVSERELDRAQWQYEKQLLEQYKTLNEEYAEALKILEVEI